jgi:hypothetical protein
MSWSFSKTDTASAVIAAVSAYIPVANALPLSHERTVAIQFTSYATVVLHGYPPNQMVKVEASGDEANLLNTVNIAIQPA